VRPVVLEEVAVDEHPARVLELQEILDHPRSPGVARVADAPRQRLEEVVAADLDVGGHEVHDGGIGAAEHDVLAGSLQVVVDDPEGSRPIPAADGLRVSADLVHVADVRVNDGRPGAVHRDAPPQVRGRSAVNVHPVEDQVVRHVRRRGGSVPQRDQVVAGDVRRDRELQADEPVVMGAGSGGQHRPAVRADELRKRRRRGRRDPGARRRQSAIGRRGPDDDPAGARLVRQREVAGEFRPGFERDDVTRLRRLERRLEVAAGGHRDRAADGWHEARVDAGARELRAARRPPRLSEAPRGDQRDRSENRGGENEHPAAAGRQARSWSRYHDDPELRPHFHSTSQSASVMCHADPSSSSSPPRASARTSRLNGRGLKRSGTRRNPSLPGAPSCE